MAYKTPTELKALFEGGDVPTQQDFADLIDSTHEEIVSVKSFGATGNGTTDDTTAIQNAVAAVNATGGTVYLPAGTYKVTALIELASNVRFVGAGASTLINFEAVFDIGITNNDHTNGNSNIFIGNLRLDGKDQVNDPIELNNASDCIIENIWVTQGNHDGIELQSCTHCIISKCIANNSNTFGGIELDSCTRCIIADCIVYDNAAVGFEIDGTSVDCIISGGIAQNNGTDGVAMNINTQRCAALNVVARNNGDKAYDDFGTNNVCLMVDTGKIAIGATTPAHRLSVHAEGSNQSYAHFTNDDTGQTSSDGLSVGYDGTGAAGIVWLRENDRLRFATNNAEVWRALGTNIFRIAPNAEPADSLVPTGFCSFYRDETANELLVKVKYANGTTRTGTVASLT